MNADEMHRLVKLLADTGEAATLDEADHLFAAYGVVVDVGDGLLNATQQIIVLTIVNCAARSLRGNVVLQGRDDVPLTVDGFEGTTLKMFLSRLTGSNAVDAKPTWPVIELKGADAASNAIVPHAAGWTFGLGAHAWSEEPATVAAAVAAGGLAMAEAFSMMRGDNPYAGHRSLCVDLLDVVHASTRNGELSHVARPAWLVGLGHLGQAYAWTLGFMQGDGVELVLQDTDVITTSTLSTSILSFASDMGRPKTDVVGAWLRDRGWHVRTLEQRFDHHQRIEALDPDIALFGVDNAAARRCSESAGFRVIVDVGLGAGHTDFRGIRLRSFPGASKASDIWAMDASPAMVHAPAYEAMLRTTHDACGVTTLATRAVGAPFVGCVAAGFAIAALMHASAGRPLYSVLDLNLRDPQRLMRA